MSTPTPINPTESGRPWSPPPDYSTPKPERRPPAGVNTRKILEFLGIGLSAIIVAYLLQAFIVKPFQIPSESMEPTLEVGDRIIVNRLAYRFGSPQRGDVVVFKDPEVPDVRDLVKRVVAVAGDTIEIKQGKVYVNGEQQNEPFVNMEAGRDTSNFDKQTVPEGNVFVMGDNRTNSRDGRFWKPPWLPLKNVVGKAVMKYWPPGHIGGLG